MDVALLIVPEWYSAARKQGISQASLREKVEAFCLKACERQAARKGQPAPAAVEPALVDMTIEMYEFALQQEGLNE